MTSKAPEDPEAILQEVSDAELRRLQKVWVTLIENANQRIWYAESRRSSFATSASGLLVAGTALLTAILVNDVSYRPAFWSLLFLGLAAVGTGGVAFAVYARQTNYDYPFKKQTSTWKWFYRDALPRAKELRVPWHTFERSEDRDQAQRLFDEDWRDFAAQQRQLSDIRISAAQDLQQLYVLYVNEFYKNRFLTQIRKVITWGLIIMLVAATVAFFVALCTRTSPHQKHPSKTTHVEILGSHALKTDVCA